MIAAVVEVAHAAGRPVAAHTVAGPGVRAAMVAGVPIAAGTDYRHGSLARELALLAEAGVTPIDVLQAAPGAAARLVRRPDLGTLASGAAADLVVVRCDPLRDLGALADVLLVVQGGRVVHRHETLAVAGLPRGIPC